MKHPPEKLIFFFLFCSPMNLWNDKNYNNVEWNCTVHTVYFLVIFTKKVSRFGWKEIMILLFFLLYNSVIQIFTERRFRNAGILFYFFFFSFNGQNYTSSFYVQRQLFCGLFRYMYIDFFSIRFFFIFLYIYLFDLYRTTVLYAREIVCDDRDRIVQAHSWAGSQPASTTKNEIL